jgi:hypothetical protein
MVRFIHKLYAARRGYFWLPCPVCGREFGGHESHGPGLMRADGVGGKVTCGVPECVAETGRRNRATAISNGWWDASLGEMPDGYRPSRASAIAATIILKP